MSFTEKYKFIVSKDQFGADVIPHFWDRSETHLMHVFEAAALKLSRSNKELYSMVELGSNQAYYSLLFKHIIGKDKTLNIMVEPKPDHLERSKGQFALNECEGKFYARKVGKTWGMYREPLDIPPITLSEIMAENNLSEINLLHSDIDSAELDMLEENAESFKDGKIQYAFILTHEGALHRACKDFFSPLNYGLIYEWRYRAGESLPTDDILVYERNP